MRGACCLLLREMSDVKLETTVAGGGHEKFEEGNDEVSVQKKMEI